MSTAKLDPKIKEASPIRRSMMISKCQKVWAWLNSLRETPLGDHDKITIDHRLDMHLVSDEDHVSPWRFINLNWKGHMPQYDIKCMVDQEIKQHRIIHHQICNPSHPYPRLNWVQTSKRRLLEENTWWPLNINQISNNCQSRGCRRQHLIPWPQGGLKTRDIGQWFVPSWVF